MSTESDALTRAREALARHDAPRCGNTWSDAGWMVFCQREHSHPGDCGLEPLRDLVEVEHLRAALAEVDRLQNVLRIMEAANAALGGKS